MESQQPIPSSHDIDLRLLSIHKGLLAVGADIEPSFSIWSSNVVVLVPSKTGGVVLRKDSNDPEIWWVDGYGERPSIKALRGLLAFASISGKCLEVRAYTPEVSTAIYSRFGFQEIAPKIHAINVRTN